jgi:hypothetical protein
MDNKKLLDIVKNRLEENFKDMVVKIILFGSRVNGTAREYSDYDLIVITKRTIDWEVKDSLRSVLYELNIEYDILLSVQVFSEAELETITGRQPFIQNALETGIAV